MAVVFLEMAPKGDHVSPCLAVSLFCRPVFRVVVAVELNPVVALGTLSSVVLMVFELVRCCARLVRLFPVCFCRGSKVAEEASRTSMVLKHSKEVGDKNKDVTTLEWNREGTLLATGDCCLIPRNAVDTFRRDNASLTRNWFTHSDANLGMPIRLTTAAGIVYSNSGQNGTCVASCQQAWLCCLGVQQCSCSLLQSRQDRFPGKICGLGLTPTNRLSCLLHTLQVSGKEQSTVAAVAAYDRATPVSSWF